MRTLALCAGFGGLEIGLELAGWQPDLVAYAENQATAAAVMARHRPDVPNLGDLTQITNPPQVDLVTAGFPCQPVSTAGLRKGTEDERWLIDDVCRVARLAGASTLVLENVAGLLTANGGDALARVCAAMAREGFGRWEWGTLRASDIGAPHQRKRWFCIATSDAVGGGRDGRARTPRRREVERAAIGRTGPSAVADADGGEVGPEQVGIGRGANPALARPDKQTPADAEDIGLERSRRARRRGPRPADSGCPAPNFGPYTPAVERWGRTIGRPAPDPTVGGRLSPHFVEWMMGLPDGWVTDTPGLTRPQQLHILGNGVVPQQAAAALRMLTCEAAA